MTISETGTTMHKGIHLGSSPRFRIIRYYDYLIFQEPIAFRIFGIKLFTIWKTARTIIIDDKLDIQMWSA